MNFDGANEGPSQMGSPHLNTFCFAEIRDAESEFCWDSRAAESEAKFSPSRSRACY